MRLTVDNKFTHCREVGGVRCIPFMQVLLMLTTDLDAGQDRDRAVLDKLLATLIAELGVGSLANSGGAGQSNAAAPGEEFYNANNCCSVRSNLREMQLVIMRLFSVLMSRSKSWQGSNVHSITMNHIRLMNYINRMY